MVGYSKRIPNFEVPFLSSALLLSISGMLGYVSFSGRT